MDNNFKSVMLVVREALEHDSLNQMRVNIIKTLERQFDCCATTFFIADKAMKSVDRSSVIYHNLDDDLMTKYAEYFFRIDPFFSDLYFLPSVITLDEIVSRKKFLHTEYYNSFLKKLNIENQMTLILKSGKFLIGAIALLRGPNTRIFSVQERQRAVLLVPFLSEITAKYITLAGLENRSALFESLLAYLPCKGKILINEYDDPIYIDEGALQIIHSMEDSSDKKKIRMNPSEFIEVIKFQSRQYFDSKSWHDSDVFPIQLRIELPDNKKIDVLIHRSQSKMGSKSLLICLEPISLTSSMNIERNMDALGLTRRHKEISYLVLQGLRNVEIADKLFISRYTVENHLKLIYDKLDVTNRVSLFNKLTK